MKDVNPINILETTKYGILEIPFFQRAYVWDEDDWEELIRNIMSSPKDAMPFLGTIIFQSVKDSNQERFHVIDGQQRITTFSIIARALLDTVGNWKENKSKLPFADDLINFIYSHDSDDEGNTIYETLLKPSKVDEEDSGKIFNPSRTEPLKIENFPNPSNYIKAYFYFYELFINLRNSGEITDKSKIFFTKETRTSFTRKFIKVKKYLVEIILDENEDAQQVFDGMNRLGKDLTSSEIIKNLLFQRLIDIFKEQHYRFTEAEISNYKKDVYNFYLESWYATFENKSNPASYDFWNQKIKAGKYELKMLDFFLKHFATIEEIYVSSRNSGVAGLSNGFKDRVSSLNKEQTTDFLKKLISNAKIYYEYMSNFKTLKSFKRNDYFNCCLLVLDSLDIGVFDSVMLKLKTSNLSKDELDKRCFALEKFVLLISLFDPRDAKNFNKISENLLSKFNEDFVNILNDYVKKNIEVNFEKIPSKWRKATNIQSKLFLFLLELYRREGDERKYESDGIDFNYYELEHVLPKRWQKHWSDVQMYNEMLEPVTLDKKTRDNILKSVGNHTLLAPGLNESIGNNKFKIKIEGIPEKEKGGYKKFVEKISLTLDIINKYDKGQTEWDERNIFSREKELLNEFVEVYKFKDYFK